MSAPVTNPVINSSIPQSLHWTQRPPALVAAIDEAFQAIVRNTASEWGVFNGDSEYNLCGVKDHELMKRLILEAPADQKDFYALDIGAGNFQWGTALAEYLNKQTDLPPDIRIHIIGIRGERYVGNPAEENGRCKIYRLGGFKAEELESEFKKVGLDLTNKIDLAVSHWCIRHLADPLGTVFTEVYPLLRPRTGMFLLDGFFFLYENQSMGEHISGSEQRLTRLFLDTHAPFITQYNNNSHSMNHYMLKRPDDTPLQLRMGYDSLEYVRQERYQVGSQTVTCFTGEHRDHGEIFDVEERRGSSTHYGDKRMHEWLKQNHLLLQPHTTWHPLLARDLPLADPSLHKAILAKDEAAIQKCLDEGCDINESNSLTELESSTGRTPLHLALETGNLPLFQELLRRGADTTLSDGGGKSVLHLAAEKRESTPFFNALLEIPGMDLNLTIQRETPLDSAIEGKNLFAIEALLKRGVIPRHKQIKKLQEADFAPIHPLLPKSCDQRPEFQQIIEHIRAGDTVLLTSSNRRDSGYIFRPDDSNGKVLQVIADDETDLFDYSVLRILDQAAGYNHRPYFSNRYNFKSYTESTLVFRAEGNTVRREESEAKRD